MQKLSSLFTFTMQKLSSSIFDNTGYLYKSYLDKNDAAKILIL